MRNLMIGLFLLVMGVSACKKDTYYKDGGIHEERFNGTIMDYLDSKAKRPIDPFDTLVQVIRFAGLEEAMKKETITFFAVPDPCLIKAMVSLNKQLNFTGKETIRSFKEVKPAVWRYFLTQYMVKGDYGLIDIPQIDTLDLNAFPGQLYQTLNPDESLNVGVFYQDLKNGETVIKYKGPRQILISHIPSGATAAEWYNTFIASSNIRPANGRVHVINYNKHVFGFDADRFVMMAMEKGIDYEKK